MTREHGPSSTHDAKLAKKQMSAILNTNLRSQSTRDCYGYQGISVVKCLKRASDDSAGGSTSTCKSSSKRKFERTWLKDFPWLTYTMLKQTKCWTLNCRPAQVLLGSCLQQFVEFSKIYYCIVTKHTRQDAFKFFLCCNFY